MDAEVEPMEIESQNNDIAKSSTESTGTQNFPRLKSLHIFGFHV